MKNYLNFETDIKNLETELEKVKDPYNQEGLSEVDTKEISRIQLELDNRLNEIEKCVVLYQMGALIGNDIFNEIKVYSTFECSRDIAVSFLKKNESFIDY